MEDINIDVLVKSLKRRSFRGKPESRVPGENRDPVFGMVPDFREDDVWTPAFAGVTHHETFCETIMFRSLIFGIWDFILGEVRP